MSYMSDALAAKKAGDEYGAYKFLQLAIHKTPVSEAEWRAQQGGALSRPSPGTTAQQNYMVNPEGYPTDAPSTTVLPPNLAGRGLPSQTDTPVTPNGRGSTVPTSGGVIPTLDEANALRARIGMPAMTRAEYAAQYIGQHTTPATTVPTSGGVIPTLEEANRLRAGLGMPDMTRAEYAAKYIDQHQTAGALPPVQPAAAPAAPSYRDTVQGFIDQGYDMNTAYDMADSGQVPPVSTPAALSASSVAASAGNPGALPAVNTANLFRGVDGNYYELDAEGSYTPGVNAYDENGRPAATTSIPVTSPVSPQAIQGTVARPESTPYRGGYGDWFIDTPEGPVSVAAPAPPAGTPLGSVDIGGMKTVYQLPDGGYWYDGERVDWTPEYVQRALKNTQDDFSLRERQSNEATASQQDTTEALAQAAFFAGLGAAGAGQSLMNGASDLLGGGSTLDSAAFLEGSSGYGTVAGDVGQGILTGGTGADSLTGLSEQEALARLDAGMTPAQAFTDPSTLVQPNLSMTQAAAPVVDAAFGGAAGGALAGVGAGGSTAGGAASGITGTGALTGASTAATLAGAAGGDTAGGDLDTAVYTEGQSGYGDTTAGDLDTAVYTEGQSGYGTETPGGDTGVDWDLDDASKVANVVNAGAKVGGALSGSDLDTATYTEGQSGYGDTTTGGSDLDTAVYTEGQSGYGTGTTGGSGITLDDASKAAGIATSAKALADANAAQEGLSMTDEQALQAAGSGTTPTLDEVATAAEKASILTKLLNGTATAADLAKLGLGAAAIGGLLSESSDPAKRTSTTKVEYPDWYNDASKSAIALADKYAALGADSVAPLSANEQAGIDLASTSAGGWQDQLDQAATSLDSAGQEFTEAGALADTVPGYLDQAEGQVEAAMPYFDDAGEMADTVSGYLNRAGTLADEAAGGIPSIDLSAYMNPYLDNVLTPIARRNEIAKAKALQDIRAKAGMRGAFGGSRSTLLESQTAEAADRNLNEAEANIRSGAFTTGLSAAQQDLARKLQAAGAQGALGAVANSTAGTYGNIGKAVAGTADDYTRMGLTATQAANARTGIGRSLTDAAGGYRSNAGAFGTLTNQDMARLMSTGATSRGVEQAKLDAPLTAIGGYAQALRGNPGATTTATTPEPSQWSQGLGALGALAGANQAGWI